LLVKEFTTLLLLVGAVLGITLIIKSTTMLISSATTPRQLFPLVILSIAVAIICVTTSKLKARQQKKEE